jgi:uncharacterized membrane protein YcaP (DUF421 family)
MAWFDTPDWATMFIPDTPLLEIFIRGTAMYLGIFVLLRVLLRREVGMVSLPDVLMIVLLADAAQNGMAAEYRSITDGMLLIGVIAMWNMILDRVAFHFPAIRSLIVPPPLPLVKDGKMLLDNMRKESVSKDELWMQLRAAGISGLPEVKAAYIEGNGEITVIKRDQRRAGKRARHVV